MQASNRGNEGRKEGRWKQLYCRRCGELAGVPLMIAETRWTTARNNKVSFVSERDYFLMRTFTKRRRLVEKGFVVCVRRTLLWTDVLCWYKKNRPYREKERTVGFLLRWKTFGGNCVGARRVIDSTASGEKDACTRVVVWESFQLFYTITDIVFFFLGQTSAYNTLL